MTIIMVKMIMNMTGIEIKISMLKMVNIINCLVITTVAHIYKVGERHNKKLLDNSPAVSHGSIKLMTWNTSGIMSNGN